MKSSEAVKFVRFIETVKKDTPRISENGNSGCAGIQLPDVMNDSAREFVKMWKKIGVQIVCVRS